MDEGIVASSLTSSRHLSFIEVPESSGPRYGTHESKDKSPGQGGYPRPKRVSVQTDVESSNSTRRRGSREKGRDPGRDSSQLEEGRTGRKGRGFSKSGFTGPMVKEREDLVGQDFGRRESTGIVSRVETHLRRDDEQGRSGADGRVDYD